MKKEEFDKLQPEIQEYIQYCINIGIFNSENKEKILDKLSRTEIKYVDNKDYGGFTYRSGDKIIVEICKDKIEMESKEFGWDFKESLDENLFHELTHASSMLDDEIQEKMTTIFFDFTNENNSFPFLNAYGYAIVNEYIAQSIAQKLVAEKYKEKYKDKKPFSKKHRKFVYNENGYISQDLSFSYEYDSDLNFYGEIEEFALKFAESLYGKQDVKRLYRDHFSGNIFDVISNEFKRRANGLENLYKMFGNMSNIIIGDYYQQGYLGSKKREECSISLFKNSVNEFNRIADFEIYRQQRI